MPASASSHPQHQTFGAGGSLTDRLAGLHDHLLASVPVIDRIACALYDAQDDMLRTFINSTRAGIPIAGYEFRLADSPSLSRLAESREFRVLDDLQDTISPTSPHSRWVLEQGYKSSFTVPMFDSANLTGFIFFDSVQPAAFDNRTQRDLVLFCNLVNMTISGELAAVRSINSAVRLVREIADMRDFETGSHLARMARYARLIARELIPTYGLTDEFVEHIYLFSPLHDIGKVGIPDTILLKPGPLTAEERQIMQRHVGKGLEIVDKLLRDFSFDHLTGSDVLRDVVGCHHEFLDGSGYPNGLSGDAISLAARIVTVADIFDAMTSRRPYKGPWRVDQAIEELRGMAAAGKLDSACVNALIARRTEVLAVAERFGDPVLP